MPTEIVNLKHEEYDIYIGRPSIFGNPYPVGNDRSKSIKLFKKYFYKRLEEDLKFKQEILKLKGKRLGCFCKPQACHGDIIVNYLNGKTI